MKTYLERWPELKDFLADLDEKIYQFNRPAHEVILDDVDLCRILKISKRLSAKLRAERLITYHKSGGKIYYLLSDVLVYATQNRISAIYEKRKLK